MGSYTARRGVTLIELLIVLALLALIMGLLVSLLSTQLRASGASQARNELRVKLRTAAEILAQDLELAGARFVATSSGEVRAPLEGICMVPTALALSDGTGAGEQQLRPCLEYEENGDGHLARLVVYYASSLRPANPCRRVSFDVNQGRLRRGDVRCDAATPGLQPVAEGIDGVRIVFRCARGDVPAANDPLACLAAGDYPRQAAVTVAGRPDGERFDFAGEVALTATLRNMRPQPASE